MSSSYQNIIALVFASIVVLSMWYFDKETKNIHANIKIIQNMLKVVISNQQEQLNLHHNNVDSQHSFQEEQRQYIPYDVPNNEIIDDETEHNIEPENVDIEQCDEKLDTIEEEEVTQSPTPSIEEIEKPKKKRTYKKKNVISV